ncbi:glucose-6-phosphate dehydrogenase [uncultured Pluralibacter sp.]|uniref:glucose-6-phosphate dehydrogenase n=1 Tax=uncultured Pluralibacter sp. TaxID=1490864 RepID=UPI00261F50EE|nr:glucose-6-phosphate dehydrogenase [uncultured Pluralibacter sp.]
MKPKQSAQLCDLVIFGARGDLARRKLLPSLYQLEKAGLIHPQTRVIGVGRVEWSREDYLKVVRDALKTFMSDDIDPAVWERLSGRLDFFNLDVTDTAGFKKLAKKLGRSERTTLYYFAMPPSTFSVTCEGLGKAGLNHALSRVIMEKPLGNSLASFREIDDVVSRYFTQPQVYRIDHYLGKETVLNLFALRCANGLFLSNWDNRTIDQVQITVSEDIGIEGRWGYFDPAGQMRDMIQSHLLQILTIVAMSPPVELTAEAIHDEKVRVLKDLKPIDKHTVRENTVRGQYTSGFVQGKSVPGYLEEKGANPHSTTETFVAIRVDIDSWRWAGVPFYLRTGKRMPVKYSEIVVYFKRPQINLFSSSFEELPPNKLTIRLQPDEGIDIEILNKVPGLEHKHRLGKSKLDLSFNKAFNQAPAADAYERLLLEAMNGDRMQFLHRDEVEAAWAWVDSIMEAWASDGERPRPYPAGTWGPVASDAMIARSGHAWSEIGDKT